MRRARSQARRTQPRDELSATSSSCRDPGQRPRRREAELAARGPDRHVDTVLSKLPDDPGRAALGTTEPHDLDEAHAWNRIAVEGRLGTGKRICGLGERRL